MMKRIAITVMMIIPIVASFWAYDSFIKANKTANEHVNEVQHRLNKKLGKTVIIGNDTLVVIKTNFWNEYVLSDGRTLGNSFFENINP